MSGEHRLGPSLGQIAYEAYGESVEWMTVSGMKMPTWAEQMPRIQTAWNAAGVAAGAAAVTGLQRRPLAQS